MSEFLLSRDNDPISYSNFNEFGIADGSSCLSKAGSKLISWMDRCLSVGYRFPGAPYAGFFSRFLIKYSKLSILQVPCVVDSNLNLEIAKLINIYFKHLNINLSLDKVSQNIPKVFKSHQIKYYNSRSSSLSCAPIEIIQFQGYECIFLLNRKINVVGYAHGGGYDVVSNDPLTYFEKKISDTFFGWGFSEDNVYQKKYFNVQKSYEKTTTEKIIWIEAGRTSKFTSYCYPLYSEINFDKDIPSYIYQELVKSGVKYFNKTYPGKLESNRYKNFRGNVISSNQPIEKLLGKNDVVILDNCLHSIMYHCLENNILFLIVDKRSSVKRYTPKMLNWYVILRKNNLLFHNDESGAFCRRIKSLKFSRELPKEVYIYYKNTFNLTNKCE